MVSKAQRSDAVIRCTAAAIVRESVEIAILPSAHLRVLPSEMRELHEVRAGKVRHVMCGRVGHGYITQHQSISHEANNCEAGYGSVGFSSAAHVPSMPPLPPEVHPDRYLWTASLRRTQGYFCGSHMAGQVGGGLQTRWT